MDPRARLEEARSVDVDEAAALAEQELTKVIGVPCAVVRWSAQETRSFFYFVWNSKRAIESSAREGVIEGVGPAAVEKRGGRVHVLSRSGDGPLGGEPPRLVPPGTSALAEEGARTLAQAYLDAGCERAVVTHVLDERAWCWVFNWNDERYLAGDMSYALVGGGPLVVSKETGAIRVLGSATPWREQVEHLERDLVAGERAGSRS
jgi:hypothetical protein